MISDAPPVPVEVRLERMRMALAEVGVDGSRLAVRSGAIANWFEVVPHVMFWRAAQVSGTPKPYCFRCWEADDLGRWGVRAFRDTCLAPVGVYDCGRSDR